ncbi:MAG: UbiA family prenyltransferase, partial [Pseudomonadota bacterium]
LLLGAALGPWTFIAAIIAVALAWAYSAPPFRFKADGWIGPAVVGISYEGVAWFTGATVMLGALPGPAIIAAAFLYSLGAHGIMTLNDFKAIEGDRASGVNSLPVRLGPDMAARVACIVMLLPQLAVVGGLIWMGAHLHAGIVSALVIVQAALMVSLLKAPREKAPWFNATGTSLYVLGMLVTAFAIGANNGGPPWP